MNNKYLGFYTGIVVQNNDPDHAGKVKVWVPHISPTVYSGWISNVSENKRFKFLGANVAQQFTMIVEDLKQILPWAATAQPLSNEGASGRYFANSQYGTISDSNNTAYIKSNTDYLSSETQNKDNIGEKPANIYEQPDTVLNDMFNSTENGGNHVNPFSFNYRPNSYSNCAKGSFNIPSVGAHVWVFFREGDINYPVVCFSCYGATDWEGIYDNNDYPGASENIKEPIGEVKGNYTHNVDKYRSKYVLNQKGGTFEIINTDHNEKIKLTHYSGSYKEFNNSVTSELATGNDQKLVLGDQYNTIKGNKNTAVGGDSDEVIKGDRYVKIGNQNYTAFRDWRAELIDVADAKQLFDIKRTNDKIEVKRGDVTILKFNSYKQTQSVKKFADNDVYNYTISAFNQEQLMTTTTTASSAGDSAYTNNKFGDSNEDGQIDSIQPRHIAQNKSNPTDGVVPKKSTSSMNGEFDKEDRKEILKLLTTEKIKKLFSIEEQMGIGGSEIKSITKDKVETIGLLLNDFGSIRIDSKGKYYASEMKISADTSFVNKTPSPLIEYVSVDDFPGGTYTLNANNKFNLLVGAGGMNLKSYGCANIGGTITNISGEQVNIGSRNEINIVSDKRINISADILTLRQKNQKQILVDSSLGVSKNIIIGGKSYFEQEVYLHHITAPREVQATYQSVVYAMPNKQIPFGTFIVNIAGDGAGTDTGTAGGGLLPGEHTLEFVSVKEPNPDSIICAPHGHNFDNIPLTLMNKNSDVRTAAKDAGIDA